MEFAHPFACPVGLSLTRRKWKTEQNRHSRKESKAYQILVWTQAMLLDSANDIGSSNTQRYGILCCEVTRILLPPFFYFCLQIHTSKFVPRRWGFMSTQ
jgi:hypothetical protein